MSKEGGEVKNFSRLEIARLAFSGALIGAALVGLAGSIFGWAPPSTFQDVVGAVAGGGTALGLLKLLHVF